MNDQLLFPHGYLCEVRVEGCWYGTARGWALAEAFREQTSDRDPAGELTYWASVFVSLREAHWRLREGNPLTAIVEDPASQCLYVLSATPTRTTPDLPLHVPPSWSPEPCSRRYGSPPPDDQDGPNRRGRHRRARLFA
ncbi:hypothetical protein [Streptomyces acidiscabies]|uniref:hypothetical protein n=1 Tax=Streptomyces acidiscabies TaxID=42234 RepID=UPI000A6B889F|nr:hypothetical protein [Streptomyces acidiscabies]